MRSSACSTLIMPLSSLSEPDRQAGGRPLHAPDALYPFGETVAELVEVVRLELYDHVEGAGDGIHGYDLRILVLQALHLFANGTCAADLGLDQDVPANSHRPPRLVLASSVHVHMRAFGC